MKDAIRDGIRAVKNTIEDEHVIPGAGAFEIAAYLVYFFFLSFFLSYLRFRVIMTYYSFNCSFNYSFEIVINLYFTKIKRIYKNIC
jgi:hypothetical protein